MFTLWYMVFSPTLFISYYQEFFYVNYIKLDFWYVRHLAGYF